MFIIGKILEIFAHLQNNNWVTTRDAITSEKSVCLSWNLNDYFNMGGAIIYGLLQSVLLSIS